MKNWEFVPWNSVPKIEWYNRVNFHQAPIWYHHLDFLNAYVPKGGILVFDGGKAFLPWPVHHRFGLLKAVYQPLWIQRFDLLTANKEIDKSAILETILKNHSLVNLSLSGEYVGSNANSMRNRVLPVDNSGHYLRNYNTQTKRNLKNALLCNPRLIRVTPGECVLQYFQEVGNKLGIPLKTWQKLNWAIQQTGDLRIEAFKLIAETNGEALAHLLVLKDEKRIYNLLPSTTAMGRKVMAMTTLLHELFNTFDGQGLIFDFEGSMNPGIDRFYEGFGATVENYSRFTRKK